MGHWAFLIRLFQNEWSPWLKLAEWGLDRQRTFSAESEGVKVYQDVAYPKTGYCTGYEIRVTAEEGASLQSLHTITASGCDLSQIGIQDPGPLASISLLSIPAQSQIVLLHPRSRDLCSPTSTAAAMNYLLKSRSIDPVVLAEAVRDQGFDIYGNWVLNTAAAYDLLGGKFPTHVARLSGFGQIHEELMKGRPVVVSVKGALPGAPLPYNHGHLIFVTGYDGERRRVLCMDPGFDASEKTLTSYPLEDFLEAWTFRRKNLTYLFGYQ
jgi:hypothetical protein